MERAPPLQSRGSELLAAEEEVEQEEDEEGGEGASGIEEGIPGGGGARSYEGLVNFVESGIGGGDEPGVERPGPVPAPAVAANAAIQQQVEDEIFDEMGRFPDQVVKGEDEVVGGRGQQPAEEGLDDVAGVRGGKGVGGGKED